MAAGGQIQHQAICPGALQGEIRIHEALQIGQSQAAPRSVLHGQRLRQPRFGCLEGRQLIGEAATQGVDHQGAEIPCRSRGWLRITTPQGPGGEELAQQGEASCRPSKRLQIEPPRSPLSCRPMREAWSASSAPLTLKRRSRYSPLATSRRPRTPNSAGWSTCTVPRIHRGCRSNTPGH